MISKIILLTFEYPTQNNTTELVETYEKINNSFLSNSLSALLFAFLTCYFTYLILIDLAWSFTHYGMYKGGKLFKLLTLGKGNATKVSLKSLVCINIASVVIMCSIISGAIPELILKFFEILYSIIQLVLTGIFR